MSSLRQDIGAEAILEHTEWVRRLARSLVASDHDVDDTVQETWLRALQSPPRSHHRLRSWFGAILRNVVNERARSKARRDAREERAATPASADDLAVRSAIYREIVDGVERLPRELREVVQLRYVEGLSTADIARALTTPASTVRTRLQRGLDRMRARLDRAHGHSRQAWKGVLAPVVGLPMPAPTGAALKTMTGVLLMSTKTKMLAAAAVVTLGIVGVTWMTTGDTEGSLDVDPGADGIAASGDVRTGAVRHASDGRATGLVPHDGDRSPGTGDKTPAAPDERSTSGEETVWKPRIIHGVVVGLRPEAPWTTPLTFSSESAAADSETVVTALRADGTFEIDIARWEITGLPTAPLHVHADDPFYLPVQQRIELPEGVGTERRPIEVRVDCAAVVTGTIHRPDGSPLPGAGIDAYEKSGVRPEAHASARGRTDESGRYRLRVAVSSRMLLVGHLTEHQAEEAAGSSDKWQPRGVVVPLVIGTVVEAPPLHLRRGFELSGTVTRADGGKVEGAEVYTWFAETVPGRTIYTDEHDLIWRPDGSIGRRDMRTRVRADGTFALTGLAAMPYGVRISHIANDVMVLGSEQERVVMPPDRNVDFHFGGQALDLVLLGDGERLERAVVTMKTGGSELTSTAFAGAMRVFVRSGQRYGVEVKARGFKPGKIDFRADGAGPWQRTVDLERGEPRSLTLKVVSSDGAPIQAARFYFAKPSRHLRFPFVGEERVSEEGVYVWDDWDRVGTHVVRIDPPRRTGNPAHSWLVRHELELVVPETGRHEETVVMAHGGRMTVRLKNRDGLLLEARCRVRKVGGDEVSVQFYVGDAHGWVQGGPNTVLPNGVNTMASALPAGDYEVEFSHEKYRTEKVRVTIAPGKTRVIEKVLDAR